MARITILFPLTLHNQYVMHQVFNIVPHSSCLGPSVETILGPRKLNSFLPGGLAVTSAERPHTDAYSEPPGSSPLSWVIYMGAKMTATYISQRNVHLNTSLVKPSALSDTLLSRNPKGYVEFTPPRFDGYQSESNLRSDNATNNNP